MFARPGASSSKWLFQLPSLSRCLVVHASQFQHILGAADPTGNAYAGDPLAMVSLKKRGMLLETFVRTIICDLHPHMKDEDARSQTRRVDGRRLCSHQEPWDWTLGGRRIESKSAQLCDYAKSDTWRVDFRGVKLALDGQRNEQPFDDLYLLIYTPSGFAVLRHDLKTGVQRDGLRTALEGYRVSVVGSTNQSWEAAVSTILAKLIKRGSCELLCWVDMKDPRTHDLYAGARKHLALQGTFLGSPLNGVAAVRRGHRIQQMAVEIDQMTNPEAVIQVVRKDTRRAGNMRASNNAAVDWIRDGIGVEIKHAQPSFCSRDRAWHCTFSGIKTTLAGVPQGRHFDELWLALYSPCGITFWRHPVDYEGLAPCGKLTALRGSSMELRASRKASDLQEAVSHMKSKLGAAGCTLLATVWWDEHDCGTADSAHG